MAVSEEDKRIFNHACGVFGSRGKVICHRDDDGNRPLDVLACEDEPASGVTSYSTIGLSTKLKQWETRDGLPFGVELCGACNSEITYFPNVLITAAYYAMSNAWELEPDVVHPGIVGEYELSETMKHLFLIVPFLWEPDFGKLYHAESMTVWLQGVPISDAELQFQQEFGSRALKTHLEEHEVMTLDIHRSCSFSQ